MRGLFSNWGNVALYSLSILAVLAIGGAVFTGVNILQNNGNTVERAANPPRLRSRKLPSPPKRKKKSQKRRKSRRSSRSSKNSRRLLSSTKSP